MHACIGASKTITENGSLCYGTHRCYRTYSCYVVEVVFFLWFVFIPIGNVFLHIVVGEW